mmetsp:Transcript_20218/g.62666  ORF Transcript_20218/g.62666 Transcript_20218/m.62666 type:complete len:210 (-) Transcript_20218:934-1563(-)
MRLDSDTPSLQNTSHRCDPTTPLPPRVSNASTKRARWLRSVAWRDTDCCALALSKRWPKYASRRPDSSAARPPTPSLSNRLSTYPASHSTAGGGGCAALSRQSLCPAGRRSCRRDARHTSPKAPAANGRLPNEYGSLAASATSTCAAAWEGVSAGSADTISSRPRTSAVAASESAGTPWCRGLSSESVPACADRPPRDSLVGSCARDST